MKGAEKLGTLHSYYSYTCSLIYQFTSIENKLYYRCDWGTGMLQFTLKCDWNGQHRCFQAVVAVENAEHVELYQFLKEVNSNKPGI